MKGITLLVLVGLIGLSSLAAAQELYRWVDEKGTIHFTDDPTQIPEKYRQQIETRKIQSEPSSQSSAQPPALQKGSPTEKPSDAVPRTRDQLGRGEEWWHAAVKEANDRLEAAQKKLDSAKASLEAAQKQLDEGRLKPKHVRRQEIWPLEKEIEGLEKEVAEARNTREKLQKEAEVYGADPNWLKDK